MNAAPFVILRHAGWMIVVLTMLTAAVAWASCDGCKVTVSGTCGSTPLCDDLGPRSCASPIGQCWMKICTSQNCPTNPQIRQEWYVVRNLYVCYVFALQQNITCHGCFNQTGSGFTGDCCTCP